MKLSEDLKYRLKVLLLMLELAVMPVITITLYFCLFRISSFINQHIFLLPAIIIGFIVMCVYTLFWVITVGDKFRDL